MLDLLSVPFQPASLGFQRQHRVGVKIVTLAVFTPRIRRGVARPIVNRVCFDVVASGQPCATAAVLRSFLVSPAFRILLNHVKDPKCLSALRIDAIELARARDLGDR